MSRGRSLPARRSGRPPHRPAHGLRQCRADAVSSARGRPPRAVRRPRRGPGVEDDEALDRGRRLEAADLAALAHRRRDSPRGHDHGDACCGYQRRPMWPSSPSTPPAAAGRGRSSAAAGRPGTRGRRSGRCTRAACGPSGSASGRRRARPERRAPAAMPATVGRTISRIARSCSSGVEHRRRRVGAHAAGVRPGRRRTRACGPGRCRLERVRPSRGRTGSLPRHPGTPRPRSSSPAWPNGAGEGEHRRAPSASSTVAATTTPLPAASPSALTTTGRLGPGRRLAAAASSRIKEPAGGGRNAVPGAERLGEGFGALEPRGRSARAEGLDPGRLERSTRPSASGSSGPGTTSSTRCSRQKATSLEVIGRERHAARLARDRIAARRAQKSSLTAARRRAPSRERARGRPRR